MDNVLLYVLIVVAAYSPGMALFALIKQKHAELKEKAKLLAEQINAEEATATELSEQTIQLLNLIVARQQELLDKAQTGKADNSEVYLQALASLANANSKMLESQENIEHLLLSITDLLKNR